MSQKRVPQYISGYGKSYALLSKEKIVDTAVIFVHGFWGKATSTWGDFAESGDVTISSISASAPFSQTNNCPSTLPAAQSCQIQVTFQPTKNGQASGTLSVTDNAPDSPQTVALSGTGTTITLSPIGVNFGSQKVGTSSNPVKVTLSNQGTTTLNISQITIGGTNPGDFSQTNDCGSSLAAGSQCTIQVTFTPTQTGQRSASLQVFDDVTPNPQQVALAGTGT
jgi:hypothetical protein